jgi:hypothetical protein
VATGQFATVDAADLACAGQAGVLKPGLERSVYVTGAAVAAIADKLVKDVETRAVLGGLLAGVTFDLTHVCGSGDPGEPQMSPQDWIDALDYARPEVNIPAGAKVLQWFTHLMWPLWCDCTDGTSPPENTVTPPPVSDADPNTAPGPIGGGCWNNTRTKPTNTPNGDLDWNDIFPAVPPVPPIGTFGRVPIQSPLPSSVTATLQVAANGSNPLSMAGNLNFFTAGGTLITTSTIIWHNIAPGTSSTQSATVPTNAASWQLLTQTDAGASIVPTNDVGMQLVIYCEGQSPTSVITPCCPPDPSLDLRLRGIMDMLTQLLSLQRLEGPYADTVRHAGLHGQGVISINPASSAIRLEVQTDLASWPHNPQTPNYYFSLGFITPFAVGTPLRGQRLIYQHQTLTWPSYTDQIGYTLADGLVVDLVEMTQGAT